MLLNSAGSQVSISSVHSWSSQMLVVRTWFFSSLTNELLDSFKIFLLVWLQTRPPDRGESTQYFEVGSIRDGIWCSPRIYSLLFFVNKITWISPVFVFLSFLPTVINHHWSGLAWICVHRGKDKILSAKVSQNIFLDFYKLRDNFFDPTDHVEDLS